MKNIGIEKLLRIYVIVSTIALIILLAGFAYTYNSLNQLKKNDEATSQALGAIANGVRQACGCSVDY